MNLRRLFVLCGLLWFSLSGNAGAAEAIRIAYQPSPLYAPLFVAKANKWVEEELAKAGVPDAKVVWASFAGGPVINEAFAAGQQDIGFLGDTPALIGKSVGIDARVVGLSVSGPKGQGVIVGAVSSIQSARDLKGKKIAVMKGSFAQHLLALVLEKEGLGFDDVQVINMGPADIPVAIVSGSVDAGVTWEPFITKFENDKVIRVLVDGTGLKDGVQPIVATQNAVKNKRLLVDAVLRAYVRGADSLKSDPKSAAILAEKEANLSPDLLEKVFAKQNFAPPLTDAVIGEFKKTEAYMREIKLLKTAVDVDAWIDRSFFPPMAR